MYFPSVESYILYMFWKKFHGNIIDDTWNSISFSDKQNRH